MGPPDSADIALIDHALEAWRQGDCVLGEHWFLFRTDTVHPLTLDGTTAAAEDLENVESQVVAFMVVTQTCDLVRSCADRPFVEVCPLVEVGEKYLREIERGKRPNYALVPTLSDARLVADLDRVMTVEKGVLARWERVAGWQTDHEARRLSLALARKRARFAFPDDFVAFARPLSERMLEKHDRNSDEGHAMRALREIRIRANPAWDADAVTLFFWLVRDDEIVGGDDELLLRFLADWLARVPPIGRFTSVDAVVATLDDLSAREYIESDPLDLDHLSAR